MVETTDIYDHDFFISFSNKDSEIVSQIVNVLEKIYGAKCWFQTKDSKEEYVDAIMAGIEKAKAFLIFISPDSANSYFVLNEVNHAISWWQDNPDYKILPIVIGPEDLDITDPTYKRIRFYLGRLNMLFFNQSTTIDSLILKIFEQTGIKIKNETLQESLYYINSIEAERLDAQHEMLKNFSSEFFKKLMPENALVLDVGCAAGDSIILNLDDCSYQSLLGIDKNELQIEKANAKYGSPKNDFICCDVFSEEFENAMEYYLEEHNAIGFDIINISHLLLHLKEPIVLLKKIRRYLKKNGYVFLNDPDDDAIISYPHTEFFELAKSIWADSKESGDRHCARKIPDYLNKAGFTRISLGKCGISNVGMDDKQRTALWDDFCNYHLWDVIEDSLFFHVEETKKLLETYKIHYDDYKKEYDEGKIFLQIGSFFYYAQK